MSEPEDPFQEHHAGWDAAMTALREAGWTVTMTSDLAPVQLEGQLPGGKRFYFRARHQGARLTVWGGADPSGSSEWHDGETCEGASSLPGDEGRQILERLAQKYYDTLSA